MSDAGKRGPVDEQKMEVLKKEATDLRQKIDSQRRDVRDKSLVFTLEEDKSVKIIGAFYFKQRRRLFNHTGRVAHEGKIYDAHWCEKDSRHIVSAGQEGNLIVWDTWDGNKVEAIRPKSQWVTAVAFANSGRSVACGGLDNIVRTFQVDYPDEGNVEATSSTLKPKEPTAELAGHRAMVSKIRFISDTQILSSALDDSLVIWDTTRKIMTAKLKGHSEAGVTSFDFLDDAKNTVASCGLDQTCRIWDLRTNSCVSTMTGHTGDINALARHPCGTAFGTASSDGSVRLWDVRADQVVEVYQRSQADLATMGINEEFHTLTFSKSGRLLFTGVIEKDVEQDGARDTGTNGENTAPKTSIQIWDVLNGDLFMDEKLQRKATEFNKKATVLQVSPDGNALMTAGWDKQISIWFPPQGETSAHE